MVPSIGNLHSSIIWLRQIWPKYGCCKVYTLILINGIITVVLSKIVQLEIYDKNLIRFLKTLYSCLPSWSNDDPVSIIYIWYICIAGFFVPSVVMIAANVTVMYILRKVRLQNKIVLKEIRA